MFYKYTCVHSYIPWADCDYYFNFNFKKSNDEVVASNPCSNRPVKCDQYEGTFWTYNIKAHYVVSHPSIPTENIPNYISENEKKSSFKYVLISTFEIDTFKMQFFHFYLYNL